MSGSTNYAANLSRTLPDHSVSRHRDYGDISQLLTFGFRDTERGIIEMQQKFYSVMTVVFLAAAVLGIVHSKMNEGESYGEFFERKFASKTVVVENDPTGEQMPVATYEGPMDADGNYVSPSDQLANTRAPKRGKTSDNGSGSRKWSDTELVVGVSSNVPDLTQVTRVEDIPWNYSAIRSQYSQLSSTPCEIMEPGSDVAPPLLRPSQTGTNAIGRLPAFTIGLKIDPKADAELPAMTGDRIRKYVDDHRLAITVPVYSTAGEGYFLGPDVRAAFFNNSNPMKSIAPEPIVAAAVRNLHVIGYVGGGHGAASGRTLMLGFRFVQDDPTSEKGTRLEYEFLLVHLLDGEEGDFPRLTVFTSQDGRARFNELDLSDPIGKPSIASTIRFADFTMAGLYPAKPIVTGIRPAARLSVPAQTVQQMFEVATSPNPMPEVLEDLHNRPATFGLE